MDTARSALGYFANVRIPSERANSIQIVQMCSAFQQAGKEVTLYHPRRINRFTESDRSIYAYYGVPADFAAKKIFSIDFIDLLPQAWQPPAFRLQSFTFGLRAVFTMRRARQTVFYIRDNATLMLAASLLPVKARQALCYEAHDFPIKPVSARALVKAAKKCGGIVSISNGLAQRFQEAGMDPSRIHVAPDGVDTERFKDMPDRIEARGKLGLPREGSIAVYTGQLFDWKGVDTLVEAARHLPECTILLVGGSEADRRRLRDKAAAQGTEDRIEFVDQVPPGDVPVYLRAADLVVLPNSGRFPISASYTSPMKLFEYMAARRPIVASDLPSLREVLRHEENALLVAPDDPQALARAMARLLTDTRLGDTLRSCAARDVERFSWKVRAQGILAFIEGALKR